MRIKDRGVIAFVTNGGFLDSNTADGMRQPLAGEFSQIYVYNLRGNQRTAGEESRREGGKVFDAGSRATVAITILVKNPAATGPVQLHYRDIGDYLSRRDKLRIIRETGSIEHLDLTTITPNTAGDWLNQRRDDFERFMPIGSKDERIAVFGTPRPWTQFGRPAPAQTPAPRRETHDQTPRSPTFMPQDPQFSPQPVRKMFTKHPRQPTLLTRIPAGHECPLPTPVNDDRHSGGSYSRMARLSHRRARPVSHRVNFASGRFGIGSPWPKYRAGDTR